MSFSTSTSADALLPAAPTERTTFLWPSSPFADSAGLALQIAVASITTHLLVAAWIGTGLPPLQPPSRPAPVAAETVTTVENVQLEPVAPAPPEPPAPLPAAVQPPSPADLALPPLPALPSVAAVAASVPVAFGIEAKGPVRLVATAALASGAVRGRGVTEPVVLDAVTGQDLVLADLPYPPRARYLRQTGTVVLEFRATAGGDITDVRVRSSSGHPLLDDAARENLASGRWKGRPGNFLKAFEFSLR